MDTIEIIYDFLKVLESKMGYPYNVEDYDIKKYNISKEKWFTILEIMVKQKFINGLKINKDGQTGEKTLYNPYVEITFEGLMFLTENSMKSRLIRALELVGNIMP